MGYRGKLLERQRARELRARSWTLKAIAEELGVAKSSVSIWVRDVEFTPRPVDGARAHRRGPNKLQRRKQHEIEALLVEGRRRIGDLDEREFLVAGAALYAGEGSKGDGRVKFTNSDARLVAFFCTWLRRQPMQPFAARSTVVGAPACPTRAAGPTVPSWVWSPPSSPRA
jgi:hypothetical protein